MNDIKVLNDLISVALERYPHLRSPFKVTEFHEDKKSYAVLIRMEMRTERNHYIITLRSISPKDVPEFGRSLFPQDWLKQNGEGKIWMAEAEFDWNSDWHDAPLGKYSILSTVGYANGSLHLVPKEASLKNALGIAKEAYDRIICQETPYKTVPPKREIEPRATNFTKC